MRAAKGLRFSIICVMVALVLYFAKVAMVNKSNDELLLCWAWAGWEPDRHYRRLGRSGTSYFGRGHWLDMWRKRSCDSQSLKLLHDSGITHLVTYCYKGFGLELEQQEWPRLQDFVANAHDLGFKVWGYVQGGSIYYETMLLEQPSARDWAGRWHDGQTQTWGGSYFRLTPCLNHPDYLAYMDHVLTTAIEQVGLDGIHMDNNYYRHCWCERCAAGFRDWLGAMPDLDDRVGIPESTHIQPPPIVRDMGQFSDPLHQLWMEYGVRTRLAAMSRFRDAIKQANPDAWFIGNPAFPRRPAFKAYLAIDPSREGGVFDALFAENGNLPRVSGDSYVTQAEAYHYAEAAGYRVLSTAWQRGIHGHTPPTSAPQMWVQMAEEFSYAPALLGNNWALRAAGDGDRLLMDQADHFDAFARALNFFRQLHEQAALQGRKSVAELAVLLHVDTLTLAAHKDEPALRALQQELLRRHLPFRFVFTGQALPAETRAVLVWQQSCLPEQTLDELRAFAKQPGRAVLVAGESGRFDEAFVPRNLSDWKNWLANEGIAAYPATGEDFATTATSEQHFGTDITATTPACRSAVDHLLAATHWSPTWTIDAPEHVLVHAEQASDGRMLLHCRDQSGAGQAVEGCSIQWRDEVAPAEVIFYCPVNGQEVQATPLSVKKTVGGRFALTLPAFEHYAMLSWTAGSTP